MPIPSCNAQQPCRSCKLPILRAFGGSWRFERGRRKLTSSLVEPTPPARPQLAVDFLGQRPPSPLRQGLCLARRHPNRSRQEVFLVRRQPRRRPPNSRVPAYSAVPRPQANRSRQEDCSARRRQRRVSLSRREGCLGQQRRHNRSQQAACLATRQPHRSRRRLWDCSARLLNHSPLRVVVFLAVLRNRSRLLEGSSAAQPQIRGPACLVIPRILLKAAGCLGKQRSRPPGAFCKSS